jgi:hypothetical protein
MQNLGYDNPAITDGVTEGWGPSFLVTLGLRCGKPSKNIPSRHVRAAAGFLRATGRLRRPRLFAPSPR